MLKPMRAFSCGAIVAAVLISAAGTAGASATTSTAKAAARPNIYVSLGDSYAAGYQPTSATAGHTTRNGFAYQTVTKAKAKGYHLKLVNFGCSGATTTSVLKTIGCPKAALGPGGIAYPKHTQAFAAESYLKAHRGQVALVTVSIGGNDVTKCAASSNVFACLSSALAKVKKNVIKLAKDLRTAAGPNTRIVGTTYPDVLLGLYLSKDPNQKALASASVTAFKQFINPTLKTAYTGAGAKFVDVTKATGAYGSMSKKTKVPPYGSLPTPVAKICTLTYFCKYQDIHPHTNGYAIIAGLVVGTLPKR